MPETDAKTPETNNRFVGKVQPNILDYFDTPTYNLKLYMIPESERGAEGAGLQPCCDFAEVRTPPRPEGPPV